MNLFDHLGAFAAFIMPFFNIPLIIRIIQRKSSDDISIIWLLGVWVCILLMAPSALTSEEIAFKLFGWTNLIFFTVVVVVALKYHHKFRK